MVFPLFDKEEFGVSYVRFVDEKGIEIAYWAESEWEEDPKAVMGAIMGAISGGCIPFVKENLIARTERKMLKPKPEVKGYEKADPADRKEGEVLARLYVSAFTRLEYTKDIWVNPKTNKDTLNDLASELYEELNGFEFVEDNDYWEQAQCEGVIVEDEE